MMSTTTPTPSHASSSSSTTTKHDLEDFIRQIPKVELHVHIEGTMEPELLWTLAHRNQMIHHLPYTSLEEVMESRQSFTCLEDFLQLYYQGMSVLRTQQDFYDLTYAYVQRCATQENVKHAEIFFDPQPHLMLWEEQQQECNNNNNNNNNKNNTAKSSFDAIVQGIHDALQDGYRDYQLSTKLIMCFVRHLPVDHAMMVLDLSLPHRDKIHGVGLDSTELQYPPHQFQDLFAKARSYGYQYCVAHAGEEGPPEYVWSAMNQLQVQRIDHGVRSMEDDRLIQHLSQHQIPLTVCPLSNICLCVFDTMKDHNLKRMLEQGVCVTINSDDPAYFGGYITDNFLALQELDLSRDHHIQLVKNSIQATFLEEHEKDRLHQELQDFVQAWDQKQQQQVEQEEEQQQQEEEQ